MRIKKLTVLALFTTLAFGIYAVESLLPPLAPIPGIKLGLSNIITLVLLRNFSGKDAAMVLLARILLSALFFGQALSLAYSLTGGLLSLGAMYLSNRLFRGHFLFLTGIAGSLTHNLGQLLAACLVFQNGGVFFYFPVLMLAGVPTGLFTGLCAHFLQKRLP